MIPDRRSRRDADRARPLAADPGGPHDRPAPLHRGAAQGRAPRAPRRLGVPPHRGRTRGPPRRLEGPHRPRGAGRLLHLHGLRALHRGLSVGRRPDPHPRGCAPSHLRGGARHGPAEHPLRRADHHAVLLHPPGHRRARRSWRRSRTPARPPRPSSARCCAGASTFPARRASKPPPRRPGSPPRTPSAPRAWSPSAWAAPRSAYRARSSSRTSTGPSPPVCTRCRTRANPPGRSRSGTR